MSDRTKAASGLSHMIGLFSRQGNFRFCGMAVKAESGNGFSESQLRTAAARVGATRLWHYNWDLSTDIRVDGVEFVPMIFSPGHVQGLPTAGVNGVGHLVFGWNEPDIETQAGSLESLRLHPEQFALAWMQDMQTAKAMGYTDFASPGVASDSCWLDHFLQTCALMQGCKDFVTYIVFHRYRNDCETYDANPEYQGWRDDLGYILTFYRMSEKYNKQGFKIKGLMLSEFGCLTKNYTGIAPIHEQTRYMKAWYEDTVIKTIKGDPEIISKISDSPLSRWIGVSGPDATSGPPYKPGSCTWQDPGPNDPTGADAVKAIQSLGSMAWFSIHPGQNYLFDSNGALNDLGEHYLNGCNIAVA